VYRYGFEGVIFKMPESQKTKIAVIGTGTWSTNMHQPVLKRLIAEDLIEVVGACDLREDAAASYARELHCQDVFTDPATMIEKTDPQGVIILVPTVVSAELIRQVAALGKPFMVEKPPAPSSEEHQQLIDIVGDLTHLVAYNRRHSPYITKARELIAQEKIQVLSCHFSRSRRRDPDFSTTAVHAIDTMRCLAGDWARMRLESCWTGEVLNFFIDGWTVEGARIDLQITPDTGSGEEHYFIRTHEANVFVVFPHWSLADYPGYVEVRRGKIECQRFGPAEMDLDPNDRALLSGIYHEHLAFLRALRGEEPAASTLRTTLQTQVIREELKKVIDSGQRKMLVEVSF
jgi:myo-inositol 2-dehydrogenase / D-chiro-inositol 1-dehydrogenase